MDNNPKPSPEFDYEADTLDADIDAEWQKAASALFERPTLKHLQGQHRQKLHGNRGASAAKTNEPVNLLAYRGMGTSPTDPGDAGIGTYYSTVKSVAKSYGRLVKVRMGLNRPYVFKNENELMAAIDKFGTLRGGLAQRTLAARRMTRYYQKLGHDGLIYPGWDNPPGGFTIVVFPKDGV